MKTAELTGALLDYWVARSLGWEPDVPRGPKLNDVPAHPSFRYSKDWSLGGRIIELSFLQIVPPAACNRDRIDGWTCYIEDGVIEAFGPTPLVAAMRAYVASKFGEEVPGSNT